MFPGLYKAFVEKDMSLLEVNPLIVMQNGHLRLLDAKVSFDNNSLFRHPDLMELRDLTEEDAKEIEASNYDLAGGARGGGGGGGGGGAGGGGRAPRRAGGGRAGRAARGARGAGPGRGRAGQRLQRQAGAA